MENKSRIQILDGLRVLAILMVMIFHFYARYQGKYYTYEFKVPGILNHGRLGVQLFFVISGFVITLTLAKSKTFIDFMTKRFIRLLPGMVICATFTFAFFWIFDKNDLMPRCKDIYNLLLSFTFISPTLLNTVFGTDLEYIDGSYWTIWTELQFYLLGGIIYFLSPKNFLRNYLVLVALTFPLAYFFTSPHFTHTAASLLGIQGANRANTLFKIFNLFPQNCWFLAGVVLNRIYFEKTKDPRLVALFVGIFLLEIVLLSNIYVAMITTAFLAIFLLFIYKPEYLSFLSGRLLSKVGVASYSIYLIHEFNGYLILNRLAPSFQSYNWVIPVFVIVLSTLFAILSYKNLEKPAMDVLRQLLLKKTPRKTAGRGVLATIPDPSLTEEEPVKI